MTIKLTESQLAAVDVIQRNKFTLFTGPPGSGKTTTLSHWLKDLDLSKTWCMAPTGRAAQRMMESFGEAGVSMAAKTIHASLIPIRSGYDGNGWGFYYNSEQHMPCERLIVDEMSMADNATTAALLQAVAPGTQVILIGDPDQLPPVGKGRPFLDMIESKAVPHAKLTEIHRFAGRIAHVCGRINAGKSFESSAKLNLDKNAGEFGPENLRHVERLTGNAALEALETLIGKVRDRGFDPFQDMQVIVSRNTEGPVNRKAVNERLQRLLNPNGTRIEKCPYRVGDKVMCLQNAVRETWNDIGYNNLPRKDGGSEYTANGESGSVQYVSPKEIWCRFGDSTLRFARSSWDSQVTLAYAITCHKSQGGGWPVVIYLIDDTRLNDRSLVYTAISRSKSLCLTIGRKNTLEKQIQRVSVLERKTFLREMLQGVA